MTCSLSAVIDVQFGLKACGTRLRGARAMCNAICYCVLSESRLKNSHLVRVIANSCSVEVVSFGCVYSLTRHIGN